MDTRNSHAVYWLKRDFRLLDNPALTAALADHEAVTPLYVLEESTLQAPETSELHVHAITNALRDLRERVRLHHGRVAVCVGEVVDTLDRMYAARPFTHLYSHEEIGVNRTFDRDKAVKRWCDAHEVRWTELPQTGVFRALRDRDRRARFWRQFTFDEIIPEPTPADIARLTIPPVWQTLFFPPERQLDFSDTPFELSEQQRQFVQPVSETDAAATLNSFLYERGIAYRGGISSPVTALVAGSRLSVHLAWGTLTGRMAYQSTQIRKEELKDDRSDTAKKWRSSLTAFLSRLHWRDHFIQRLESEVSMEFHPLTRAYEVLEYENDPEFLKRWIEGTTGFPMVDACIRCMRTSGFINFRMRAMLTSVACHTLHLHWKSLDHPMARMYTDYEPGIHLSQLQMQAGVVGINSLRMYSPHKQIIDQDPDAVFIKQWIPELAPFSPKQIREHRTEPLGDYPGQPIEDWWKRSRIMRSKIWDIRAKESTKEEASETFEKHGSRKGPMRRRKKTPVKPADSGASQES